MRLAGGAVRFTPRGHERDRRRDVAAHFIVSDDVERSRRFYTEVLGGKTGSRRGRRRGHLRQIRQYLDHHQRRWRPTDDQPTVTLETLPDRDRVSSFLNVRVADIRAVYAEWGARGAEFLTPPKEHGPRSAATSATPTATSSRSARRPCASAGWARRPGYGGGGIRTHETPKTPNSFQGCRIQPLCHPS